MPGLVPGTHAAPLAQNPGLSTRFQAWMTGSSPAMTETADSPAENRLNYFKKNKFRKNPGASTASGLTVTSGSSAGPLR